MQSKIPFEWVVIIGVIILGLIIFLIVRNLSDEEEFEKEINEADLKLKKKEDEERNPKS